MPDFFERLFGAQQTATTIDPKELADKVSGFLGTRGVVAQETQRHTEKPKEFLDRPPDVIQGEMAAMTAKQLTAYLRGQRPKEAREMPQEAPTGPARLQLPKKPPMPSGLAEAQPGPVAAVAPVEAARTETAAPVRKRKSRTRAA